MNNGACNLDNTYKVKNALKSLEVFSKKIADDLFKKGIPFELQSRVKSIYSIYRKIYQKHHKFEEIFDILALRIITETELNCYEILGIIHATYTPVLGRFKDYIATPKPNMYQSLHTCILDGNGNTFEVQIRTKEMNETAESGIAAHWRYKEGRAADELDEKLSWIRRIVDISGEAGDSSEFSQLLKTDLFTIMKAVTEERLAAISVEFSSGCAACVIMASEGYPVKYDKGYPIDIPADILPDVYVAGAAIMDGELVTSGGRVLGVTATADSLKDALDSAYAKVGRIHFDNAYYRHDIGQRALAASR